MQGRLVRLEPLRPDHEIELLTIARNPEIWRYTQSDASSPAGLHEYVDRALRDYAAGTAAPFVVRLCETGRLAGFTRLKNISAANRSAGVGSWFAPPVWGAGVNAEAKLLLLEYAFEQLGCIRVEFQTDSRNERSRRALAAMGAVEEGTLRSQRITRELIRRDTVVFSILDAEWPDVKRRLKLRLTPA
jgi:RimJ/RimL family protein N-acetyltransferase